MALYTDWDAVFNAATAGVMALFGLWVLTLRPRSRQSTFLGAFALVHGIAFTVSNLWDFRDLLRQGFPLVVNVPQLALNLASMAALFGLAHAILVPEGRRGRLAWRIIAGAVPGLALGTLILYTAPAGAPAALFSHLGFLVSLGQVVANFTFFYAFAALPLLFAWLYRGKVRAGGDGARPTLIQSVAFVPWPALFGADGLESILFESGRVEWIALGVLAIAAATGVLWLANIHLDPRSGKAARNAALLVFALLAFGVVNKVLLSGPLGYSQAGDGPFFGLARLATVVILTHAILKHQVLGMDVKLRFAISKSTVATVFIAIFFIASEAAQQFFGEQFESSYLGILAAGALVIAIAPLTRVADRLAEKAIPHTASASAGPPSLAEAAYQAALRAAMRDGSLTRREEMHLADVAEKLGIGHRRAFEIRSEVEREEPVNVG